MIQPAARRDHSSHRSMHPGT